MIDVLLAAGASPAGEPDNALVNGNLDAAAHLVARGAPLTLSSALCLGHFDRAAALAPGATPEQKQFALTMSALRGNAAAVSAAIGFGVDLRRRAPISTLTRPRCITPSGRGRSKPCARWSRQARRSW